MSQALVDDLIAKTAELSRDEQRVVLASLLARDEGAPAPKRVDPFGKFAHVSTSVDAFLARKAAEIDLEIR
jgi:hypothetical protein